MLKFAVMDSKSQQEQTEKKEIDSTEPENVENSNENATNQENEVEETSIDKEMSPSDPLSIVEEVSNLTVDNEDTSVAIATPSSSSSYNIPDGPLTIYKNLMEKWSIVESQEQLFQLHKDSVAQVTKDLTEDAKVSLLVKLNSYFLYISELFEEQKGATIRTPAICIYFDKTEVKMGIYSSQNSGGIDFGFSSTRFSKSYPSKIMSSSDQLWTNILKSGKQYDQINSEKQSKEFRSIVQFLKWIKDFVDTLGRTFDQTIIGIPTCFQAEHRLVLRNAAHLAGFTKSFLLTEASLVAVSVLEKPLKEIPTVVVVSVGILGVEVGMYTILNRSVKMIALEKYEWELRDSDMQGNGCAMVCLPIGGGSRLKRPMESQEDPLRILKTTYTKAADQLNEKSKQQKREIYFVSESVSWKEPFQKFMDQCPDAGNWLSLGEDWALSTEMKLSKSATEGKIRKVVIDHVIPGSNNEVDGVYFWY